MRLNAYMMGLLVAGVSLMLPIKGHSEDGPMNSSNGFIQAAKTSYCYAGTTVDPVTGETVELYNLCADDLDVA